MCWAWNLEGGWLRTLGYFDRGGSIIMFYIGSLGGMVGSIVVGPRYEKFKRRKRKDGSRENDEDEIKR